MKSLQQLRTELLDVRISITDHSLWSIQSTVTERARKAFNDAIGVYKYPVSEVYNSIPTPSAAGVVVALPKTADKVLEVYALDQTGALRIPVLEYDYVKTAQTNLLYLKRRAAIYTVTGNAYPLEVLYQARLKEFPKEVYLAAQVTTQHVDTIGGVQVTGGTPVAQWEAPGYFELTPVEDSDARELWRYEVATPWGFTGLTRVEGVKMVWDTGARVSPVSEMPAEAIPTIMAQARASMYEYWVTHRSQYEQFHAAAGVQQMDTEELLGLVRTEEDRADRRHRKTREAPKPTTIRKRRKPWS